MQILLLTMISQFPKFTKNYAQEQAQESVAIPSYQYRVSHYKDKTVSRPTV